MYNIFYTILSTKRLHVTVHSNLMDEDISMYLYNESHVND